MDFNNDELLNDRDNHSIEAEVKPNAWRVEDGDNITEEDLERHVYNETENANRDVKEGKPMGGQNFGQNNLTPAGDDKNNPSQNAGYSNAYFARTEPSEEHPEDTNFKSEYQNGAPDYNSAQLSSTLTNESPKPEKVERGDGENDRPHKDEAYEEGTADNDQVNNPGPNEVPDQQKVGENAESDDKDDHLET